MKKVYVPFRYIHIIQYIFTKNNKQTIRIKHFFKKIFVQVVQKRGYASSRPRKLFALLQIKRDCFFTVPKM